MTQDLLSRREQEIFHTLRALSQCSFVVIGGYAVNAYALPRFSADCDLVIKEDGERKKIEKVLVKRGYTRTDSEAGPQNAGGFFRHEKQLDNNFAVSLDILMHSVTDRMTGASFTAGWVFENSSRRVLRGKTIAEELTVWIIDIDALLVMKIISSRPTDIRDVFMMAPYANDKEWIKSEVARRCDLKDRISRLIATVTSKQFKDGLSGVYGYVDTQVFEKHMKAIMTL